MIDELVGITQDEVAYSALYAATHLAVKKTHRPDTKG
jgi:hypothetical protein